MVDKPTTPQEVEALLYKYFTPFGDVEVHDDLTVSVSSSVSQKIPAASIPVAFRYVPSFVSHDKGLVDLSCLPEQLFNIANLTYYRSMAMLRLVNAKQVILNPDWSTPIGSEAAEIADKYAGKGRSAVVAFAAELAAAGLKENARW
jgi:hypothetical protein